MRLHGQFDEHRRAVHATCDQCVHQLGPRSIANKLYAQFGIRGRFDNWQGVRDGQISQANRVLIRRT